MTTTHDASARDWLMSVWQARADLMSAPAVPIAPVTLGDLYAYYKCSGCSQPCAPRAFEDAAGCLWCCQCVTSDAIGAAFTQAELIALSGHLIRATERLQAVAAGLDGWRWMQPGHKAAAAEIREIRDTLTVAPISGPVPVHVLFGTATAAFGGKDGNR